MRTSLWDHVEQCTAKLELGPKTYATGTLIAPGFLMTCSHVVSAAQGRLRVLVDDREVGWSLVADLLAPFPDLALLRIDHSSRNWVRLDPVVDPGDSLYMFGYTDEFPLGESASGELEGWSRVGSGHNLKIKGGQVRPGMSGAPLLNLRTMSVCGIVRTTRDRGTDLGGRAVPVDEVADLLATHPNCADLNIETSDSARWQEIVSNGGVQRTRAGSTSIHGSLEAAQFFFGRQKELERLEFFWDDASSVLALVGVGGCGKTAMVREFLQQKGWVNRAGTTSDTTVFGWSFYDFPNTSDFLQAALDFFMVDRTTQVATVDGLLESLRNAGSRTLIVLDGLEKMQAPGEHEGLPRGSLEDIPLRQFILSIADGDAPLVKVLATSRFSLTDFSARRASGYQQLILDDLDQQSAADLLNRLGVRTSPIIVTRHFGCHALTLDLLGRLVSEFFEGNLPDAAALPPLQAALGTPGVEKQAYRLQRVLAAYHRYLTPGEVELLQRVSLFRRPVEERFVVDLLQSSGDSILGRPLAGMTQYELKSSLRRLANLRLIARDAGVDGPTSLLSCHPAVRDYFYSTIDDAGNFHLLVRDRLISLVDQPGEAGEPAPLQADLLEELIYHTVRLGHKEEAFRIYRERLGYLRLGWERGDHPRGVSVLRMIDEAGRQSGRTSWDPENSTRFAIDFALYLKNLGALDEAIGVLRSMLRVASSVADRDQAPSVPISERTLVAQNLSAVLVQRGWLPAGEQAARTAVRLAEELDDPRLLHDCRVRLATALSMQGDVETAEAEFARAASIELTGQRVVRDVLSVRRGWLLRRLGRADEALGMLVDEREVFGSLRYGIIVARLDVVRAEVLADLGRVDEGIAVLNEVFRWVSLGADQEMVIASNIARSRLALAVGDLGEVERRSKRAIRLAQKHGYVTLWIDAVLQLGWARLHRGDRDGALARLREARDNGDGAVKGLVCGATDSRVRYYWGEREAALLEERVVQGDTT